MDIGIFKASKARLVGWIIVPPLIVVAVGLSSFAFEQKAQWQLKETRALSNVLPDVIRARKDVQQLFDNLGLSTDKRIATGDQLISLLQEEARKRNIDLKRTQILDRDKTKDAGISTISAILEASGSFKDFQLFLNDVTSVHPLVSARSLVLTQAKADSGDDGFELKAVFDLMPADRVFKATGGLQ